jgi:hypothetical protein
MGQGRVVADSCRHCLNSALCRFNDIISSPKFNQPENLLGS